MKIIAILSSFLSALLLSGAASAQAAYPDRPVHILVGYVAGGPNDIIARALGDTLAVIWKQSVIVENVPGASANIAGERVARAKPDGYTLLLANMNQIVVNPSLFAKMPLDPVKDLAPISMVAFTPNVLTVPNEVPVHSVQELVAYLRAAPGKYTFGSPGTGTSQHLACELFKAMAKVDIQHVPYRGASAVVTDMLGNRLTLYCGNIAPLMPLLQEGRLRGLAVTSRERFAGLPDMPSVAESGFPSYDVTASFPLMGTTGTPADIIDKISKDANQAVLQDGLRDKLAALGVIVKGSTPAELAAIIANELTVWPKLIKEAGLRAE